MHLPLNRSPTWHIRHPGSGSESTSRWPKAPGRRTEKTTDLFSWRCQLCPAANATVQCVVGKTSRDADEAWLDCSEVKALTTFFPPPSAPVNSGCADLAVLSPSVAGRGDSPQARAAESVLLSLDCAVGVSWQTDTIEPLYLGDGVNIGKAKLPGLHLSGRSEDLPITKVR